VTSDGEWNVISGETWRRPEGAETVLESHREEDPVVSISWYDTAVYCHCVSDDGQEFFAVDEICVFSTLVLLGTS
jgi:formylglycine-generating enzyme required for sulfatase activity